MRLSKLKAGKRLHEVLEIYKEKDVQQPEKHPEQNAEQ